MRAQLHGLHDDGGEPVAALWASEGAIYGRFGYGAASRHVALSVPRAPRALAGEPTDPRLRTRLVDPAEHRAACELVRDADRLARPGMFVRDQRWQAVTVFDPPEERQGRSALRCAVVEDGDGPRAYALYATESSWEPAGPRGTVFVREAHAADPAAYATLWRFLADMDLTVKVETGMRPQDDPLLELLLDVRSAVPRLLPALHVRLVDVGRALSSRSYAGDIDLVLDVSDAFCPWNARRWHLHGGIDGARCEPTKAGADLTLSSTELGAAYLGGTSLTSLAAAGRVVEQRAGALSVATRAFRSDLQPWCPQIY
jgi:predicted acetyltransferase